MDFAPGDVMVTTLLNKNSFHSRSNSLFDLMRLGIDVRAFLSGELRYPGSLIEESDQVLSWVNEQTKQLHRV